MQCHLWEIKGQQFIEEHLEDEAVRRTWMTDARREFVAMYDDRPEGSMPVKVLWFRFPRVTGYRAYFGLHTLGIQVSRSEAATPGFFGTE